MRHMPFGRHWDVSQSSYRLNLFVAAMSMWRCENCELCARLSSADLLSASHNSSPTRRSSAPSSWWWWGISANREWWIDMAMSEWSPMPMFFVVFLQINIVQLTCQEAQERSHSFTGYFLTWPLRDVPTFCPWCPWTLGDFSIDFTLGHPSWPSLAILTGANAVEFTWPGLPFCGEWRFWQRGGWSPGDPPDTKHAACRWSKLELSGNEKEDKHMKRQGHEKKKTVLVSL